MRICAVAVAAATSIYFKGGYSRFRSIIFLLRILVRMRCENEFMVLVRLRYIIWNCTCVVILITTLEWQLILNPRFISVLSLRKY